MQTAASDDRIAEPIEGGMSTSHPAKWRAAAALVVILPAAGAAIGARSVLNAFREMAIAGRGGVEAVSTAIFEAHPPLIAAVLAAALIAGAMAFGLARKPARAAEFPGMAASLVVPVLAGVPTLFLWAAESYPLDFLAGRIAGPTVAQAAEHLESLLNGTMVLAIAAIGIAVIAWRHSLNASRAGQAVRTWPLVSAWAGAAVLLVCLAAAFYMRSSYLVEAALRGRL